MNETECSSKCLQAFLEVAGGPFDRNNSKQRFAAQDAFRAIIGEYVNQGAEFPNAFYKATHDVIKHFVPDAKHLPDNNANNAIDCIPESQQGIRDAIRKVSLSGIQTAPGWNCR